MKKYTFTSLTRISSLQRESFAVKPVARSMWQEGDYVVGEVTDVTRRLDVELTTGRMIEVMRGDLLVGALGTRRATLEMVGDWRRVGDDLQLDLLTGGGIWGKVTSRSAFSAALVPAEYRGHVHLRGKPVGMADFVPAIPQRQLSIPVFGIVGTSMSAGKTTCARLLTKVLKEYGLTVAAAKLTGAGRYRDVLTVGDAGADHIFDFVDGGLPSTACAPDVFLPALNHVLSLVGATDSDVLVAEVGASPLEPYNGRLALEALRDRMAMTFLSASDPYAVVGVVHAFGSAPDVVTGVAANTEAGIALIEKLTALPAFNLFAPDAQPTLRGILEQRFGADLAGLRGNQADRRLTYGDQADLRLDCGEQEDRRMD